MCSWKELVGSKVIHANWSFLSLEIKFIWGICTLGPHGGGELVRERESSWRSEREREWTWGRVSCEGERVCVYYICGTQMTKLGEIETLRPEYPGQWPEYSGRVLQSSSWNNLNTWNEVKIQNGGNSHAPRFLFEVQLRKCSSIGTQD